MKKDIVFKVMTADEGGMILDPEVGRTVHKTNPELITALGEYILGAMDDLRLEDAVVTISIEQEGRA